MRKRRGGRKTTRRKAAKTAPAWVRVIKHFIIGTGVVIACLIGGLFIYDYFFPIQQVSRQTGKEQKKIVSKPTVKRPGSKKESGQRASAPASSTKTFQIPARTEIPQLKAKRKEQIIRHEGYTVSYNSDYRIAKRANHPPRRLYGLLQFGLPHCQLGSIRTDGLGSQKSKDRAFEQVRAGSAGKGSNGH